MHFLKPDPSPKWMSPTASGLSYEVGRIGKKKVNGDWDISNKRGHNIFHTLLWYCYFEIDWRWESVLKKFYGH